MNILAMLYMNMSSQEKLTVRDSRHEKQMKYPRNDSVPSFQSSHHHLNSHEKKLRIDVKAILCQAAVVHSFTLALGKQRQAYLQV